MRTLIFTLFILFPVEADAQSEPSKFNWTPSLVLSGGLIADRLSTHFAITNGDCKESNPRYTRPPYYAPTQPNYKLMWVDAGIIVGTHVLMQSLVIKLSGQVKWLKRIVGANLYTLGAWFGWNGIKNMRCV